MLSIYMVQLFANFSLWIAPCITMKIATLCLLVQSQQLRLCGPQSGVQTLALDLHGLVPVRPVDLKFGTKLAIDILYSP